MNYNSKEIKQGVTLHTINTNNFKTNLYAVFLATPLTRENVTLNALLTAVLRRGTNSMKSQDIISKKLEEMYGASFDCGIDKTGDNHIIKFYLEAISEEFLPEKEEITEKCLDILFDIVFNPLIENEGFKEEYIQGEKENLKQIIEGKIDNKGVYALDRCREEMFKGKPYGLYKFGYVEDLEKIPREPKYIVNTEKTELVEVKDIINVQDHMQVNQGKLVIGLTVNADESDSKYTASVYNAILGGGANSKLFQNVRAKNGLAYPEGSNYVRKKNTIFIRCGIEISNYEKAVYTIKEQLNDMKNGNFEEVDIENAKNLIIESIKSIPAEQDTEITYYYGQELSDTSTSIDEYISKIQKQSKEDIINLAQNVSINTIYFLRD